MLRELLLSPARFYKNISIQKIDLRLPVVIIILNNIIEIISSFYLLNNLKIPISTGIDQTYDFKSILLIGFIFGGILSIIVSLLVWLAKCFVFHVFASFLGGKGNYRKLLEMIGYSYFPLLISSVVTLILIVLFTPPLENFNIRDIKTILEVLNDMPIFIISRIFGRFCLFWAGILSIFAIREVYKISTKKAAVSVLVPVVLYLAISETIKSFTGI